MVAAIVFLLATRHDAPPAPGLSWVFPGLAPVSRLYQFALTNPEQEKLKLSSEEKTYIARKLNGSVTFRPDGGMSFYDPDEQPSSYDFYFLQALNQQQRDMVLRDWYRAAGSWSICFQIAALNLDLSRDQRMKITGILDSYRRDIPSSVANQARINEVDHKAYMGLIKHTKDQLYSLLNDGQKQRLATWQ